MSNEEIEEIITILDHESRDLCVFPERQNFDCSNCYMCRVDYFNRIRNELRNE